MRFQRSDYDCGPTSLGNAITALGYEVSYFHIEEAAKTDKTGTREWNLIDAAREFGFKAAPFQFANPEKAWLWLKGCLDSNIVVILCVEQWDHWVTAISGNGDFVTVIDPAKTPENKENNGVVIVNKEQLKKWWAYTDEKFSPKEEQFYGIAVTK